MNVYFSRSRISLHWNILVHFYIHLKHSLVLYVDAKDGAMFYFQEKGEALLLMTEERLRHTLIPQYQQLFSKIGRIDGGVKFLVDMRADILVIFNYKKY